MPPKKYDFIKKRKYDLITKPYLNENLENENDSQESLDEDVKKEIKQNMGKLLGGKNNLFDMFKKKDENIKVVKNQIYFYEYVSKESILSLTMKLRELINKLMKESIDKVSKPHPIYLHINSYGGDLYACRAAVDMIIGSPVPVITIIEGYSASAATIMSVCGHKRYIRPHSEMLIHQLSSGMEGKFMELSDEYSNMENEMKWIKSIYTKYTKLNGKKLDDLLKHDLSLDAQTCLKHGLVDEIGDPTMDFLKNYTVNL